VQLRRIGPGMVQQMQSACGECGLVFKCVLLCPLTALWPTIFAVEMGPVLQIMTSVVGVTEVSWQRSGRFWR
jgi:hypothetical protein